MDLIKELMWASDTEYVYFDTRDADCTLYRVRIADVSVESILSLRGLPDDSDGAAVTPDGSPLIVRGFNVQEIYALDVDWP